MDAIRIMVFAVFLLLPVQPGLGAGDAPDVIRMSKALESYTLHARPQKIYLHLDKAGYLAGEAIWFKAYLLDGISHYLDTTTNNLYVELINSVGNIVEIRILMVKDGYAHGEINLGKEIADGNYIIRAYTDWMRNFPEEYFFSQHLYIENHGYENMIPRPDIRRNRRFNRNLDKLSQEYTISFFPEGGNLLQGTINRVAFKVVDMLGLGQPAEGDIIDHKGTVVSTFQTGVTGIGVLEINPESGSSYRAKVSVNGNRPGSYDFPEIASEGYSLRIDHKEQQIKVSASASVMRGNPLYSDKVLLIGHTRGIPYFTGSYDISTGNMEDVIDKALFPSGIAHFTLFTDSYRPVAERLIYIDGKDYFAFATRFGKFNVDGRDFMDLQIRVTDDDDNPVAGSFSLSAVTGRLEEGLQNNDIVSSVLLASDLIGVIQEPWKYMMYEGQQDVYFDDLLMTYGWQRFDWDHVSSAELPEIIYPPVRGLSLGGRVTDPAKNEGIRNHPVELKVKSGHNDLYTTQTERNGTFLFTGLEYEGTVDVELSSKRLPANYPPVIDLNVKRSSGYDYEPGIYSRQQRITARGEEWERIRRDSDSPYGPSTGSRMSPQLYGVPDQTIFINPELAQERNLYDVLRNRASGMSFDGGQITMRGPTSLVSSNEPRFMLDGVFINRDDFLRLYPKDVERIEIFRGPGTAIFGVRGATGVILAYSRRPGSRGFEDVLEFAIMGYHSPALFNTGQMLRPVAPALSEEPARTVYWNPDLLSDKEGRLNISFPLYQGVESLKIIIEGAGLNGGIGFAQFMIDLRSYTGNN